MKIALSRQTVCLCLKTHNPKELEMLLIRAEIEKGSSGE
jgi:hypothetical protein